VALHRTWQTAAERLHESFIGRLREELLNETLFASLAHVREALMIRKNDYNLVRPHSAIGNLVHRSMPNSALLERNGSGRLRAPPRAPLSQQDSWGSGHWG
jgi:putative transposase